MPVEEQTQGNYANDVRAAKPRSAQKLTISNRIVTKLAFLIKKEGTPPSADVVFALRRVSDDGIIASKVWGDAGDLPASQTWEEVELDEPILVNEEVRMSVEYPLGDSSNCINAMIQNTDVKADEYRSFFTGGAWSDSPTQDHAYRYTYEEPTVLSTVTTNPATAIATLNGTLDDDGGEACDCGFQWGKTVAYGNTTPTQSRTTGQTFSQAITP